MSYLTRRYTNHTSMAQWKIRSSTPHSPPLTTDLYRIARFPFFFSAACVVVLYKINTTLHFPKQPLFISSSFLMLSQFAFWNLPILQMSWFGAFIKNNVHQEYSSRNIEVEEPGYNERKHHASEKEVEEPVPLPKSPSLGGCCLGSCSVAWFIPLLDEVRITETCHVARGWATDFADPKTMKEGMETLKTNPCLHSDNMLWCKFT